MQVRHPDGQVFAFDAGALCLELSGVTGGEGARARYELFHTPADFPRWVATSRLGMPGVDPDEVTATDGDLALVRRLREALWACAWAAASGAALPADALLTVNEVAGLPGVAPMIDPARGERTWQRPVSATQLAAEFARDAVAVLGGPARSRVRMCAADDCYLIYLDTSRPGNRRWCSMQRCGNRAKVRGHRDREERP